MRSRWADDSTVEPSIGRNDARDAYVAVSHDDRGVSRVFAMTFADGEWTLLREDPTSPAHRHARAADRSTCAPTPPTTLARPGARTWTTSSNLGGTRARDRSRGGRDGRTRAAVHPRGGHRAARDRPQPHHCGHGQRPRRRAPRPLVPGGWSARDILGHMRACNRTWGEYSSGSSTSITRRSAQRARARRSAGPTSSPAVRRVARWLHEGPRGPRRAHPHGRLEGLARTATVKMPGRGAEERTAFYYADRIADHESEHVQHIERAMPAVAGR